MPAAYTIRPRDSELAYEGRFARPAIRILAIQSGLYDRLLAQLQPYGAQVSGLRADLQSPDLSQASVTASLFAAQGLVRVHADRWEVRAYGQYARSKLGEIASNAWTALSESASGLELAFHSITLAFHAELVSAEPQAFLARFATPVAVSNTESVTSGVSYAFGPDGDRLSGALLIEQSATVANGIFTRMIYSSLGTVTATDLYEESRTFVRACCSEILGIEGAGEVPDAP